jgi:hypothetical protein
MNGLRWVGGSGASGDCPPLLVLETSLPVGARPSIVPHSGCVPAPDDGLVSSAWSGSAPRRERSSLLSTACFVR